MPPSAAHARSLSPGHAKKRTAHPHAATAVKKEQVNKRAFELPHVRSGLVGLDTFFATHRPLLELPVRLGARRSPTHGGQADSAYVPKDGPGANARSLASTITTTSRAHPDNDLVEVIDQADDGSPLGAPYLVRLSEPEPLKSVEEELAAEASEEAELAQQEEMQHEIEATEDRPYEPWLLGQRPDEVHSASVARYLASRPPFTAPASSPVPSPPSMVGSAKDLDFIAAFQPSSSDVASTLSTPTDYSATFSSHFVDPLSPNEATGAADRFLSHHEVLYRWSAQTDFVNAAGEALRRAGQGYTADAAASSAKTSPVLEALRQQRGSVRLWTDADGYISVPLNLAAAEERSAGSSVFLPAEDVIVEDVQMDSVKRKRQKKIRKHKHRKRRYVRAFLKVFRVA